MSESFHLSFTTPSNFSKIDFPLPDELHNTQLSTEKTINNDTFDYFSKPSGIISYLEPLEDQEDKISEKPKKYIASNENQLEENETFDCKKFSSGTLKGKHSSELLFHEEPLIIQLTEMGEVPVSTNRRNSNFEQEDRNNLFVFFNEIHNEEMVNEIHNVEMDNFIQNTHQYIETETITQIW